MVVEETTTSTAKIPLESLTNDVISKLRFREAQSELEQRELDTSGTLSAMRDRLRQEAVQMSAATQKAEGDVVVMDEETLNKVSNRNAPSKAYNLHVQCPH
jgi:hypothetical protein